MVEFAPSFSHTALKKSTFAAPTRSVQMTQIGVSHSSVSTHIAAATNAEPRE